MSQNRSNNTVLDRNPFLKQIVEFVSSTSFPFNGFLSPKARELYVISRIQERYIGIIKSDSRHPLEQIKSELHFLESQDAFLAGIVKKAIKPILWAFIDQLFDGIFRKEKGINDWDFPNYIDVCKRYLYQELKEVTKNTTRITKHDFELAKKITTYMLITDDVNTVNLTTTEAARDLVAPIDAPALTPLRNTLSIVISILRSEYLTEKMLLILSSSSTDKRLLTINLSGANLDYILLNQHLPREISFYQVNLSNMDLSNKQMDKFGFKKCIFKNSKLSNSTFHIIVESDFTNADLSGCKIHFCASSDFTDANLAGCRIQKFNSEYFDLTNARTSICKFTCDGKAVFLPHERAHSQEEINHSMTFLCLSRISQFWLDLFETTDRLAQEKYRNQIRAYVEFACFLSDEQNLFISAKENWIEFRKLELNNKLTYSDLLNGKSSVPTIRRGEFDQEFFNQNKTTTELLKNSQSDEIQLLESWLDQAMQYAAEPTLNATATETMTFSPAKNRN